MNNENEPVRYQPPTLGEKIVGVAVFALLVLFNCWPSL